MRGHAAEAIVKYAESEGVNLIVVGQHGHSRIARFLLGSTSDRVSEHSPVHRHDREMTVVEILRSRIQGRKGDDHVEIWGKILALSVGGVAGVNARYWLGVWINRWASSQFPWATFSINVSGAFAIGF